MQMEYLVTQQINFTFTNILMTHLNTELRLISSIFQCLEFCYWLRLLQIWLRLLQIWISQARPRFTFIQFHGRKCLFACVCCSKTH